MTEEAAIAVREDMRLFFTAPYLLPPFSMRRSLLSAAVAATVLLGAASAHAATVDGAAQMSSDGTFVFPSETLSSRSVISAFMRPSTFANIDMRDSNVLQHVSFDVQAFVNHPCYTIIDEERKPCQKLFGRFADLHQALMDGRLERLLRGDDRIKDPEALIGFLMNAQAEVDARLALADDEEDDGAMNREDAWMRSSMVWSRCGFLNGGMHNWRAVGACFQGGLRLIKDASVAMDENNMQTLRANTSTAVDSKVFLPATGSPSKTETKSDANGSYKWNY